MVALVRQAGDGLAVLHAKGVVHRDIKPQNLLLTSDGLGRERLMVADLGVAKALIHASGLTDVVGTPAYMAPEQALGGGVDERADVHGLAAVAYQLLTGHVARNGGVSDLTNAKLPPAPSVFVPVVARGRRGDPARARARPRGRAGPTWRSFVEALAAAVPGAPATLYTAPSTLRSGAARRGPARRAARRRCAWWWRSRCSARRTPSSS